MFEQIRDLSALVFGNLQAFFTTKIQPLVTAIGSWKVHWWPRVLEARSKMHGGCIYPHPKYRWHLSARIDANLGFAKVLVRMTG